MKLGLRDCGRKLGTYINKRKKLAGEHKKREYITTYIPHIGEALRDILELSDAQTALAMKRLTQVLEKSRKL